MRFFSVPQKHERSSSSRDLLDRIHSRYSQVFAIVAPPRSGSTALARIFWEQPSVRYYCHEPFEVTYYDGQDLEAVERKLAAPLDLAELKCSLGSSEGRALVIKEMPYQVGDNFPLLAAISTRPLVFLMRDPRLTIASRMAKKKEAGDPPLFPRIESGWELWAAQIDWCRERGVDHLLVDSTDFRDQPLEVLPEVFSRLGLPFDPEMLRWRPCPSVELDNLGGRHRHLYERVLASDGLTPAEERVPELSDFPTADGWRDHVERCLEIYSSFLESPERVSAPALALT